MLRHLSTLTMLGLGMEAAYHRDRARQGRLPGMFSGLLALLQAAAAKRPSPDEAPHAVEVRETLNLREVDPPSGVAKVGAWVGRSGFDTPKAVAATIRSALELGLRRLDVVVNDFAKATSETAFSTYAKGDLVDVALAGREAGLDVHFMSWAMPHARFIDGAAVALRELVALTGARSIMWDAEEPWTQARMPMRYDEAARRIGDSFGGIPMGVTGIGYASIEKLRPLAEVCGYVVPQCYATQTSGLAPETVVPKFVGRWRAHFTQGAAGTAPRRVVVGLAAYRQPPAGYTVEGAMRAAFAGAAATGGISEVVYWSMGWIRKSPAIARVIRALATGGPIA